MFHIYDKKIISVTSHALDPSPVTNCHTFSDPSHPLERDVLYGRPLWWRLNFHPYITYARGRVGLSDINARGYGQGGSAL